MKEKETISRKFAAMILYFDCEQFILKAIDNCAPFVDKIYILYSEKPWSYNPEARSTYTNTSDLNVLKQSPHYSKLKVIEGEYETEEAQRNECLEMARDEGYNYLIIQDADEFYHKEDYKKNISEILNHPDMDYYRTPWYLFWKKLDYVIEFREVHGKRNTIVNYCPVFAVNCTKDVHFTKNRMLNTTDVIFLPGVCFHLSYIMSDVQMERKINTWGHAQQFFNKPNWLRYKWLGWTPLTRYINPFNPVGWLRAVKFEGTLPEEIRDFPVNGNEQVKLSLTEKLSEFIYDQTALLILYLKEIKKHVFR